MSYKKLEKKVSKHRYVKKIGKIVNLVHFSKKEKDKYKNIEITNCMENTTLANGAI